MRSHYPQRGRRYGTILVTAALLVACGATPLLSQLKTHCWTRTGRRSRLLRRPAAARWLVGCATRGVVARFEN